MGNKIKHMNSYKKLQILFPLFIFFFAFISPALAAAPDGLGPWSDTVLSFHQGLMKNGLTVPIVRSDPTSALGIAENTPTIDSTFFSLGFGGNIVLGLDNGISSGAIVIEATIEPGYPDETAKVEMSEDGINWIMAGNVIQDGTINKPAQLTCAKYVRITDTSIPANYPDDVADGFDVDGVRATGDLCTQPTPTPTPTRTPRTPNTPSTPIPTPTLTAAPTPSPTQTPSGSSSNTSSGGSSSNSTSSTSTSNTSSSSCPAITTTPNIISTNRLSPTSISVAWGPNAGLNDFIVQYGFQNGNWQFSTKVSGFSTTINNLPANQSIWIQVAATNNCSIGSYGSSVFTGGSTVPGFPNTGNCVSTGNPLVPCFPNTGNPGLPNTGIDPNGNNILSSIQMGIQYMFSLLLR